MAVPENIKKDDILKAIEKIKSCKKGRRLTIKKWAVLYEGQYFPCNLLVSYSNWFTNGRELAPSEFTNKQASDLLQKLGFKIVEAI